MLAQGGHLYWVFPSVSISWLSDTGIVLASGGCTMVEPPLFHPADGVANPKYKLLHFFTTIIFFKEKKALAFNWDRCCNLALCLELILFHWLRIIRLRVWFQMPLSLGEIKGRGGRGGAGNTKGGSITVLLISCLTGLESLVRKLTIFVFICKTD